MKGEVALENANQDTDEAEDLDDYQIDERKQWEQKCDVQLPVHELKMNDVSLYAVTIHICSSMKMVLVSLLLASMLIVVVTYWIPLETV